MTIATTGVEIVAGDDYYTTDGLQLSWSSTSRPSLTGASATFTITGTTADSLSASVTISTGSSSTQTVSVELPSTGTASLAPGTYGCDISATLATTHKTTLVRSTVTVLEQYGS